MIPLNGSEISDVLGYIDGLDEPKAYTIPMHLWCYFRAFYSGCIDMPRI